MTSDSVHSRTDLGATMAALVLVDGRNVLDAAAMRKAGFVSDASDRPAG
jgi:hypothetical protein